MKGEEENWDNKEPIQADPYNIILLKQYFELDPN